MSADNGIYIGHFADGEIRVVHAQAIDNCWYPDDENAQSIVDYFKNAAIFNNAHDAGEKAFQMESDILNDEYCPVLEYGISSLKFKHPFSYYEREVKAQQEYNENR